MHTRPAEMVALPTVQAGEPAFVPCSSSFYIGMLSRAPAMEELCLEELCSEELLGKESEKHLESLTSQSLTQLCCQRTAYMQMSLWQLTRQRAFTNRAYSQMSLRQLALEIAFSIRACRRKSFQQLTLQMSLREQL